MKKNDAYIDFGNKIGGAKKDLWIKRGLLKSDIEEMNAEEKRKYVTKHTIWLKPDYEKLIEEGRSRYAVYYIKKVRDSLPVAPIISSYNIDDICQEFIDTVSRFRDLIMKHCKQTKDIITFWDVFSDEKNGFMLDGKIQHKSIMQSKVITLLHPSVYNLSEIMMEADNKAFGIKKEEQSYFKISRMLEVHLYDKSNVTIVVEKNRLRVDIKTAYGKSFYYLYEGEMSHPEGWKINTFFIICTKDHKILVNNISDRKQADEIKEQIAREMALKMDEKNAQNAELKVKKKKFLPQQLENVFRTGEDYRNNYNVRGKDMLDNFGFYGGEFGNWLSENDRRWSLNMAFDAFIDLAKTLNISIQDVSLDHRLSIAFGARGSGSALAHYEPLRKVINLTKMKGAGSLAHEWGHALDHYLQLILNQRERGFATEAFVNQNPILKKIVDALKYKKTNTGSVINTDFYKNSILFGSSFFKQDKGYWESPVEMFARAFACYINDKCEGQNDYLTGHAECAVSIINGKVIKAFPIGEERDLLNALFDELFQDLREKNVFSPYNPNDICLEYASADPFAETFCIDNNSYYQMSMFDML